MNKRRLGVPILCWLIADMSWFAPIGFAQEVSELRPNLQAFPAYDLAVVRDCLGCTKKLIFSATTWNSGNGPLELRAGETGPAGQNVYQRVYLDNGGFYDRHAGTFEWHPGHGHFHFNDYALYTLQPVNAPGGSQRTSSKTTFCIIDTNLIDSSLPGAPQSPVYITCNPDVQGMSIGWGDTYGNHLAGQEIDLTDLPNGDYKLVIEVDPKNRLLETNDGDNSACALLRISVTNSTVDVLNSANCDGSGAEVVVSGIAPNTARRGSVINVTTMGSGFISGMNVSFENGSGPPPIASNVRVQDANRITATVTVKNGKPGRDRIWDVRVGAAVLVDGFTVLR